jgi:hypothetical protein
VDGFAVHAVIRAFQSAGHAHDVGFYHDVPAPHERVDGGNAA